MFERLGRFAVRRRRLILGATLVAVVLAAVLGTGAMDKLRSGGFEDPHAQSTRAKHVVEDRFGQGDPNLVLLLTRQHGSVDSAAARRDGQAITATLRRTPQLRAVASYWDLGSPAPLRSRDGTRTLVLARVVGSDQQIKDSIAAVRREVAGTNHGYDVRLGGVEAVFDDVGHHVESDLRRAEMIAVPITLLLLLFVFDSAVAAALPLVIGGIAIVGTLFVLYVISSLTNVSIYAINLTTALGLGLAIDYSLFIVSRFREELRAGHAPDDAVVRAVIHAGRTVAFSALTVAISLSALLVFPLYFLRSFAYAGAAVVLIAALAATISLPALLAVLGPRVDAGRVLHRHRPPTADEHGFWHRMASTVMHHPIPIATAVIALLVFLGLPFAGAKFGLPDDRVLPASAESRTVSDVLRRDFGSNEDNAFAIAVPTPVTNAAVSRYANTVSRIPGVARVDARTGSYIAGTRVAPPGPATQRFVNRGGTWLSVVPSIEPVSSAGEHLVRTVRATPAPFPHLVGGRSAQLVDTKHAIFEKLPLAAGIIAVATFVLLFLMFGSLLVPTKALVLNVLSLSATFGAMVWVFQDGHGSGILNFTATGTLDTTMPILMFCIAFGLSMDYEVFLLSRIKEEHDRSGENVRSVALGLERTGRLVTAASALLAVTFIAFSTSGVTFIKLFGLGLTVAVIVDATIVRATLVPAFMRLAGEANWWAPAWLRRVHQRFGLHESVTDDAVPPCDELSAA
jgi:RND superfamily putative drug exporter